MTTPQLARGLRIPLSNNRHVAVGIVPHGALLEFQAEDGQVTRLSLSHEAAQALQDLLILQIPEGEVAPIDDVDMDVTLWPHDPAPTRYVWVDAPQQG